MLSDERLAEIEADHSGYLDDLSAVWRTYCLVDDEDAPCSVSRLVAEIRRLRRALQLSEASRGVPLLVGRD
jgi:hypothetical protein